MQLCKHTLLVQLNKWANQNLKDGENSFVIVDVKAVRNTFCDAKGYASNQILLYFVAN